ncbi:MAG: Hsp20/alpha crystallin family protein [Candidatus Altiarchaeales archaeon]|nr:Hsp20/alpha crystallin family protein [Candidatus Altiarchaeales archaeon]
MVKRLPNIFDEMGNFGWDMDGYLEPLIHVREEGDKVIVTVDLPGVKKEDVKVFAIEKSMEVEAKMKEECRFERWGAVQRSISFKSFRRIISLPTVVDPKKAKTRFDKGVLEVTLPRKYRKRRIHVE